MDTHPVLFALLGQDLCLRLVRSIRFFELVGGCVSGSTGRRGEGKGRGTIGVRLCVRIWTGAWSRKHRVGVALGRRSTRLEG